MTTMIKPAKANFISWLGLCEATGSYYDYVDPSRAFTRTSVARAAGHPSEYCGDFEQGTPSKCYIADAGWNTFGNESIIMGAWLKGETFKLRAGKGKEPGSLSGSLPGKTAT